MGELVTLLGLIGGGITILAAGVAAFRSVMRVGVWLHQLRVWGEDMDRLEARVAALEAAIR